MSTIDLDNTDGCPVGVRCESCGTEAGDLAVETATSDRLGVLCLTLCRRCAAYGDDYPMPAVAAVKLVGEHCAHLGIDLDEMAAAMDRGTR